MAASQVEATRKAYADVMLNMAQESAARVLAAERRAAALEAGLAAAKEDGVAALVRLKAIMEARIKEVELRSLQHARKSKELEEQLQSLRHIKMKELEEQLYGAQSSVAALQFQLQVANTELEKTRKTLAEERINRFPTGKKMDSNKNTSSCSKMNLQSGSMSFKSKKTAEETCVVPAITENNGGVQNIQKKYRRSPDLPSFMERNKKPKLYHSGCTQRIHALKQRNQVAGACQERNHMHATGPGLNSRSKVRKNAAAKNPSHTRSIMEQLLQTKFLGKCKRKRGSRGRSCNNHDSSSEVREAEYKLPETSDRNGCLLLIQAIEQDLSPLKVSAGHSGEALIDLKDDSLMSRRDAGRNPCTASPELIDILAAKNMLVQKRKRSKTVRVLEADFSDSKNVPEPGNTLLRSTSEKSMSDTELISEMKDNDSDAPHGNNGPVLQHTAKNMMRQDDANNGQLESGNNSALLLQSCKNEVMDYDNLLVEQPEHKAPDNDTACLKEANGEGSCSLAFHKADATIVDANNGQLESGNSSALLLQSCKNEVMDYGNLLVEQPEHKAPDNDTACLKEAKGEGSCSLASHKADATIVISLDKEEKFKASSGLPMQALEKPNASVGSSLRKEEHGKASCGASMQVEGGRQIKYTFNRRKRKCVSTDKSSDLLGAPKDGKPHPNAVPQDNLIDSPQGDNHLVQVAQQLILLSESN